MYCTTFAQHLYNFALRPSIPRVSRRRLALATTTRSCFKFPPNGGLRPDKARAGRLYGADTLRIISLKRHGQLQQRDSARKHQQRRDRAAFRARTKVRTKKFGIRLKMNPELGRLIPPRGPLSAEQSAATLRAASGFQKEFNGTHVMIDLRHS